MINSIKTKSAGEFHLYSNMSHDGRYRTAAGGIMIMCYNYASNLCVTAQKGDDKHLLWCLRPLNTTVLWWRII